MQTETLTDLINRIGKKAAAEQFNRDPLVLERMASAGAVVIDGQIFTPAQTRQRKLVVGVKP